MKPRRRPSDGTLVPEGGAPIPSPPEGFTVQSVRPHLKRQPCSCVPGGVVRDHPAIPANTKRRFWCADCLGVVTVFGADDLAIFRYDEGSTVPPFVPFFEAR